MYGKYIHIDGIINLYLCENKMDIFLSNQLS